MNTIFRNITDPKEILSLYPEANAERLERIRHDVTSDIEDARKGNRMIYGLEADGVLVGTIQLVFRLKNEDLADGEVRANLHHARVAETYRNKGLGTMLIQHVESQAKSIGFREITLGVEEDNSYARGLYERLGYSEFTKIKGGEGETIVCMKKSII